MSIPRSLFAPDTPRRSRYRDASSGLTAYTVYPAATSAATQGPRSVSIPTTTCPASLSSASSPSCSPTIACSLAMPATPSGSRAFASHRPPRPSPRRHDGPRPSHPPRTASTSLPSSPWTRSAACGRTISDLMTQCSRHAAAGTTSHQRSTLPAAGRGTLFQQDSQGIREDTSAHLPTATTPRVRRMADPLTLIRSTPHVACSYAIRSGLASRGIHLRRHRPGRFAADLPRRGVPAERKRNYRGGGRLVRPGREGFGEPADCPRRRRGIRGRRPQHQGSRRVSRQPDLVAAWKVVRDSFGTHDVPSTLMGVTVLGYKDQLVEIEAVAAVLDS